jgi:hypothetical protein
VPAAGGDAMLFTVRVTFWLNVLVMVIADASLLSKLLRLSETVGAAQYRLHREQSASTKVT